MSPTRLLGLVESATASFTDFDVAPDGRIVVAGNGHVAGEGDACSNFVAWYEADGTLGGSGVVEAVDERGSPAMVPDTTGYTLRCLASPPSWPHSIRPCGPPPRSKTQSASIRPPIPSHAALQR
jgi:hypothetical protein